MNDTLTNQDGREWHATLYLNWKILAGYELLLVLVKVKQDFMKFGEVSVGWETLGEGGVEFRGQKDREDVPELV